MAKGLVDDARWELIEPHVPRRKPQRTGRPRVPDRAALTGIIFVLQTGIPWEYLPLEMGCGSGVTCGRRLRDWQTAGIASPIKITLLISSIAFWWYCNNGVQNILVGIALFEVFHDVQYLAIVWIYNRMRVERDFAQCRSENRHQ